MGATVRCGYRNAESNGKGASRFLAETKKALYEKVASPAASPLFRWDFSEAEVVHTYVYEQEVRNKTDMGRSLGGTPGGMGQEMSAKGALLIKSQGDGTAELVLKDMKMSMKMDIGEGEPKTMEQKMPPFVAQGMKEET